MRPQVDYNLINQLEAELGYRGRDALDLSIMNEPGQVVEYNPSASKIPYVAQSTNSIIREVYTQHALDRMLPGLEFLPMPGPPWYFRYKKWTGCVNMEATRLDTSYMTALELEIQILIKDFKKFEVEENLMNPILPIFKPHYE